MDQPNPRPNPPACPTCGTAVELNEDGQFVCPAELLDRLVEALRILGCTGPAHAEDILAAANTQLTVRERAYVLDQLDPQEHSSDDLGTRTGRGDGFECGTCGIEYEAYGPAHAATLHDLYEDHPFAAVPELAPDGHPEAGELS